MFGRINEITAVAGKRDEVAQLVTSGSDRMPGRRSCIVVPDADNADLIWVTEVWDNAHMHAASMEIPAVRSSGEQALPMIAGFETAATTIATIAN